METKTRRLTALPLLTVSLALFAAGCASFGPRRSLQSNDPWSDEIMRVQASRQLESSSDREIAVGMSMSEVRAAWGNPVQARVAGRGDTGNERWTYSTGFIANPVLNPPKQVYFEEGRVVGWETGP